MEHELIIVLDYDSKETLDIARAVRALNVYCEVLSFDTDKAKIKNKNPKGIIHAVGNFKESTLSSKDFSLDVPAITVKDSSENTDYKAFLFDKCHCAGDWVMDEIAQKHVEHLKAKIGNKKVLCALSGGVDSTVAAVMVQKAIGKNLTCIFVDHGLMRLNEGDEVEKVFTTQFDVNFIRINAQDRFLNKLKDVTNPETKRKIIGEEFIRIFEEEAKKLGSVDYLVQGTIYPDVIESSNKKNEVIKSHHNVGGLPDVVDFEEIIEPLRDLFKNEVRQVGLALGISDELVFRQPFPGPGLGIRVIGDITKEKLDILREADFIFRDEIKKAKLDREIWQYFAVLTGIRSVGVTEDEDRTYGHTIALRAVNSIDAMTATWFRIPFDVLENISKRICGEVKEVNKVVFDISSKPPSTIEWE